ncbi:MAG: type II toxin-antitoxin system HicB family antitoxin [Dehalococcoidia bacterium]
MQLTLVIERDADGFYVGSVPQLKGCHSQGRSLDELMERMKEVVQLCLEDREEEADLGLEFVGVQRIEV